MRAAIYVRVSKADLNPENQLKPLRDYVERQGWFLAKESVEVMSGRDVRRRKQMDTIYAMAMRRHIQVVVVAKLDRWGRNMLHMVESIQAMRGQGCHFVAVDQGLYIKPAGKDDGMGAAMSDLVLTVMAAMAEFEVALISERTKAGIQQAMADGRHGRPVMPCFICEAPRPKGERYRMTRRVDGEKRKVAVCADCKRQGSSNGIPRPREKIPPKSVDPENARLMAQVRDATPEPKIAASQGAELARPTVHDEVA